MKHTRREFLATTTLASVLPAVGLDPARRLQPATSTGRKVFLHGVASGDPLADRVILWTRVSGAAANARPMVRWMIARDQAFTQVVARGETATHAGRDFTVKIDVPALDAGTTYYYRFDANGEQAPIGRTRTLPGRDVQRVRLAIASCSNLPFGYFNAYGRIAARADLDAVLHLGDYIYEYPNGQYGDGTKFGRVSAPNREIVSLDDYRTRYAQYRTDPDLQEAHRQHPWIVVWDDHEVANNTWRDGAQNHSANEGDWQTRRSAAVQTYYEWMPIREDRSTRQIRIYRAFAFGNLADVVMLDTRVTGRDREARSRDDIKVIEDPARSLLGTAQEHWLFAELRQSQQQQVRWQLLGQQVMFAPQLPLGKPTSNTDVWDGYRPARDRIIDFLAGNRINNAVVLTGDVHSSWAYDIARDPWGGYDPDTGRGTVAVEIVGTSITSPSWGNADDADERLRMFMSTRPHLKWAEGAHRGYVVLDVTPKVIQADWYFVPTVEERTSQETFAKGYASEHDNPHLVEAASPTRPAPAAPDPAR